MNLRDLKYLVAVAELKHFGQAAEACHVSQPTLSMQLKKLEEYLGVQLLERSNKQVLVTQVGEAVVARAKLVLHEAEAIEEEARAARDPFAGELDMGIIPTMAPYVLPRILARLQAKFPKLRWNIREAQTQVLLTELRAGKMDVALLAFPVAHEQLSVEMVYDEPFYVALPPGHRLLAKKELSYKDIAREQLLLLEDGHCLRDQALDVCQLSGAQENRNFQATSLETLRQLVSSGMGITLMPALARQKQDGITYLPFAGPVPMRQMGLAWRPSTPRKALYTALAKCIREILQG